MDALKNATRLLSNASSLERLAPMLPLLGFAEPPLPLDANARRDLGLPSEIASAHVARGGGALRALIVAANHGALTRDLIQTTAHSLSSRVPHLLWVLIVISRGEHGISIACWRSGKSRPRVVALMVDATRVMESDADTFCALCAATSTSDILTHVRWIELLGREAITRRFFRALREVVDTLVDELPSHLTRAVRRELTILTVSRLLFLSFLETKGWLAGDFDFLANQFAHCMTRGGGYHRKVLHPLFFGTLNTRASKRAERARSFGRIPFLNGGLFSKSPLERAHDSTLSDDALSEIFSCLLTTFRFSAREDSENWSETAVDPEILGKAFEALMAADERKNSGAFYTPQRLVEHVTESGLVAALAPSVDAEMLRTLLSHGSLPPAAVRDTLLEKLRSLTILDPACGSGAFLVHVLEKVTELRLRLGDISTSASIRRATLASSIFGVDINPMAVWLCQLRLWLAIVIDSTDPDPMHVSPLPNLDRQIRVGDSLGGGSFVQTETRPRGTKLSSLRGRYIRSTGARKKSLAAQLDREERREAVASAARLRERLRYRRRDMLVAARERDLFGARHTDAATLETIRSLRKQEKAAASRERRLKTGAALPFAFDIHFADVASGGGFHLVIGNPPWVRIHNIGAATRAGLNREFLSFNRGAWKEGAEISGSGRAFGGQADLASLFIERSIYLLMPEGALSLLVPAKIWRSLSGGGIRELTAANLELAALEDMTESRSGFDAAVYPSLIVGRRAASPFLDHNFAAAVHRGESVLQWEMATRRLPLDHTKGSPWLLVPEEVRTAFDRLSASGIPLASSHIGRPVLGVKTGCNEAFVVRASEEISTVESCSIRPVVRGETATKWTFEPNGERIIWTHGDDGKPLRALPSGVVRRLTMWRATLERRADGKGSSKWWSLFRTEGAVSNCWRVVWCDFGKEPRAFLLPKGSAVVPLNTCYVARCSQREDALTLMTLLNGPLLRSWLDTIAEPARGGYRRYLGWTVSLMPIPRDWERAVRITLPVAERAIRGDPPSSCELLSASLDSYRLRRADAESLLSWTSRS